MALKNKDGTPYELTKPNPIMSTQILWDRKFVLYNKIGSRIKILNKQKQVVDSEVVQEEILAVKQPEPEIIQEIKQQELPKVVQEIQDPEVGSSTTEGIVSVWCLPADKVIDGVVHYKEKFLFEAAIVESDDLYIKIYTDKKIPLKSVIYPKVFEKRHWRVKGLEEKYAGEYMIYAEISDYQPSFSD